MIGLRPIGEVKQTAVDQFTHRPLETRLLFVILSHDCIPDHPLELFVPEAVEAVLAQKINRHRQILSDHEEAFVGILCRQALRRPPRAPYGSGKILVLLHEVPVHDVGHAIYANAIDPEVEHPTREAGQH